MKNFNEFLKEIGFADFFGSKRTQNFGEFLKKIGFADFFLISLGTTFVALAITLFFEPHDLVTGGATGLAIALQGIFSQAGVNLSLWLLNILINLPLFLIGFKIFGLKFLAKTLYATVFLSFALYFTVFLPPVESDLLLAAVFGGVLCGLGIGLVFRCFVTTGGTDLAAMIIRRYLKHYSLAQLMFAIDALILLFGFVLFGATKTMYALIAVYITSKTIDAVLEGLSFAKAAFIVSDFAGDIGRIILSDLDRGATILHGQGLYSGKDKDVIFCVVSKKEIVKLKELTYNIDSKAFLMIADIREVLGEGFQAPV